MFISAIGLRGMGKMVMGAVLHFMAVKIGHRVLSISWLDSVSLLPKMNVIFEKLLC